MFAMKKYCVVTTLHWAFHPPQWFYNFLIQISYLKSPSWSLVTNYPNCPLSCDPGAWCQDSHHEPSVTLPPVDVTQLMMERSRMHGYCRGLGRASLIMFYRVTSQLGFICSQALSYVTAPPPSSALFRLYNHRLRFPVKNQLNNLPIGIG